MNKLFAGRTRRLTGIFSGSGLRSQLVRGGVGSVLVKAANAVIAFVSTVVLARTLGATGYGIYSFVLAVLMLAAVPAQVGVPQLVIRETAKAQAEQDYGLMNGVWRWGDIVVLLFSLAAAGIAFSLWLFTSILGTGVRSNAFAVGFAVVPLLAFTSVRGARLRGLRRVVIGQLPESIVRPAVLLLLVSIWIAAVQTSVELTAAIAMAFYVIAVAVALAVAVWLLHRNRPGELRQDIAPVYRASSWTKAVMPLALITGLHVLNNYADLIILGLFRPDNEVGVYRALSQLAFLIVFGLQAINQVLYPHFARLHASGDMRTLQRLVTTSARVILLLAVVPFIAIIIFADSILSLVFGSEFVVGATALAILAIGQLANAAFGSVGALLNMTGNEKDTVRGLTIAMAANVVLNFALVPNYGLNGAAVSTMVSYVLWNAVLRYAVRRRLSIESFALGSTGVPNAPIR